ncbi:T9SS type A sorting domain-containing protein [candidate division KSB1 bacterium]|nr:T9SS type A sorting domain-containing protein [candidate division KSB1 bacterium]
MKRITFFLLFYFFFSVNLKAQEGWFWQNPLPQGNTLQGVSFSDANNGTAVGNYGTIIRTTDGGNNWVAQESGTYENLNDVSFTDANNGTTVGNHGTILNTKDGGQTWDAQSSGTTNALYGVSFSDANNGTTIGVMGVILRTIDGGKNWVTQQGVPNGWYGNLSSVSFTDVNTGTIVGTSGKVIRTTDGGNTWIEQSSGTTKSLTAVSFLDANNGIAVGTAGTFIITNDGGTSWTLMQVTENNLYDVSFTNINNCLIVGKSATVVLVTEGGTLWTRYHQVGDSDGNFYGASHNTLVGTAGQIFRTINEGTTWDAQITGPVRKLRGICFTNENVGTAVGHNGTILHTTDGGSNWLSQSYTSPTTNGSINDHLKAVSFSDANNGFAVSGDPYSDGLMPYGAEYGLILHTTNGGNTWDVPYNYDKAAFNGVSSPSANVCIAVGVYKITGIDYAGYAITKDGGVTWNERYISSNTNPLTDVSFIDNDIGTIVGYNGYIRSTTNGGENWTTQSSGTTKDLHGVCFTDVNTGTVVGDDGTILRTNDGGTNWTVQSSGTDEDFYGVSFIDADNGSVVGSDGMILHTKDGGITWEIQSAGTDEDLMSVSFVDENIGNTVGNNGTILRTTNGGITTVFEEKNIESPKGYVLSQNYPNPFNPSTQIEFDVQKTCHVTLRVYDILGRLVSTYVDQNMPTGHYKVEFHANGMASGIYLYQIQMGDYTATMKMLLTK